MATAGSNPAAALDGLDAVAGRGVGDGVADPLLRAGCAEAGNCYQPGKYDLVTGPLGETADATPAVFSAS